MLRDGDARLYTVYPLYVPPVEGVRVLPGTSARPSWVLDLAFWSVHPPEMYSRMGLFWVPDEILEKAVELGRFNNRGGAPLSLYKPSISLDSTIFLVQGYVLGRLSWVTILEKFESPTVARRLYELYHYSATQHGSTARSFGQLLGAWDWLKGDPHSRVAIEDLLSYSCPRDNTTFTGSKEIRTIVSHRTIFVKDHGHFGRSYHPLPGGIREGDILVALFDLDFPFLLHPLDDGNYRMINIAYVVDYNWGYIKDPTRHRAWSSSKKPKKSVFQIV